MLKKNQKIKTKSPTKFFKSGWENSSAVGTVIFIIYSAILIKILVFKDIPMIRIGSMMLNLGGTNAVGDSNFIPFKSILSYLLGEKGMLIGGINIVGNIALLVPIGFLAPFVYRETTWGKSLALAFASGFIMEGMQVILHVGIFDIDDVILNGLGVMIGFGLFNIFAKMMRKH